MSKSTNTKEKGSDILENPEAIRETLSKSEEFISKNQTLFYIIAGIAILAIAGAFGYQYMAKDQDKEAQSEMFQAVFYFEADSLDKALNGDGNNYGFLDIIDEFGASDAANLSHFYAGSAYLKKGEYDDALEYLGNFSSSDLLVQARAYALMGDANMELENYKEAAGLYSKAADYKENKFFSPPYLMKAAIAYETDGDLESAKKCYETIVKEYFGSNDYQNARKHKARLEALTSSK